MKSTELFSHPALFSHPYEPDTASKAEHDSEPAKYPVFSDLQNGVNTKQH